MKWLCKIFGHSFHHLDLAMLDIMQRGAENKEDFKDRYIKCYVCQENFTFINNPGESQKMK